MSKIRAWYSYDKTMLYENFDDGPDYILMKSIDIKDVVGKDIYLYDIVSCPQTNKHYIIGTDTVPEECLFNGNLTIIGNAFENKELL